MTMNVQEMAASIFPTLQPEINTAIGKTLEIKDNVYGMIEAGGRTMPVNQLGCRFTLEIGSNPNYGAGDVGGPFREPGSDQYQQALLMYCRDAITHGFDGDTYKGITSPKMFGDKVKEKLARDTMYIKKQRDIDVCRGDGSGERAKVATGGVTSTSTTSVIVMDGDFGTRHLSKDGIYMVHLPTSPFTGHGVTTTGHRLISKNADGITATFDGDMSTGTTIAAADILVNKGGADNSNTSLNKATYGFEYWFLGTGHFYTLDKDAEEVLRPQRVNGGGNNVSLSLLMKGETQWKYRWNEDTIDALTDFIPFAQQAAYKLLGYGLRRLSGDATTFDGNIQKISDGGRKVVADGNFRPTNWFRVDEQTLGRAVYEPTGIWDLDGLTWRTIPSNGVHKDAVYVVINGKEACYCNNPARGIWYFSLGTSGVATRPASS